MWDRFKFVLKAGLVLGATVLSFIIVIPLLIVVSPITYVLFNWSLIDFIEGPMHRLLLWPDLN